MTTDELDKVEAILARLDESAERERAMFQALALDGVTEWVDDDEHEYAAPTRPQLHLMLDKVLDTGVWEGEVWGVLDPLAHR